MKKVLIFLMMLPACIICVRAQESKIIRVKSGEDPAKAIRVADKYRFAKFIDGKIHYLNNISAGKLNYSILLGEIHFIDPRRDTLSLANEHMIKMVNIGESDFYYDKTSGFVEEIADFNNIKLAVRQVIGIVNSEKEGAYGQSTGVASIRTYKSFSAANGRIQHLEMKGDLLLAKKVTYFLIDQNKRIYTASKAHFFKVYAKHKKAVADYIKEELIDFKSEKDLRKLLLYCSQLA